MHVLSVTIVISVIIIMMVLGIFLSEGPRVLRRSAVSERAIYLELEVGLQTSRDPRMAKFSRLRRTAEAEPGFAG